MTIQLRDGEAKAELMPDRGGLLARLTLSTPSGTTRDLLWMPPDFASDASGWPGGGWPVCFPFAGRVFHGGHPFAYVVADRELAMPLHGFGYGLPWTVAASDERSAILTLADGPKTHDLYPFRFAVTARYELTKSALTLTLGVTAKGALAPMPQDQAMPVALGTHPYFRIGPPERTRVKVPATEKIRVTPTGAAGKVAPYPEDEGERLARLDHPLLGNLILGGLKEPRAALLDEDTATTAELRWKEADVIRYVVLWSKLGEGFHCVEPWMGLPDAVHSGLGCRWLASGESLTQTTTLSLR